MKIKYPKKILFFIFCLFAALAVNAEDGDSPAVDSTNHMILLDASNSMWGQIDGKNKIVHAREALAKTLEHWPEDVELGLMAFGHRNKQSCSDIEVLVPSDSKDIGQLLKTANRVKPRGKTPLADALRQAAEALNYKEEKATITLLSDGIANCGVDPCQVAKELEAEGKKLTINVVGFGGMDQADSQLKCLAENTGGQCTSGDFTNGFVFPDYCPDAFPEICLNKKNPSCLNQIIKEERDIGLKCTKDQLIEMKEKFSEIKKTNNDAYFTHANYVSETGGVYSITIKGKENTSILNYINQLKLCMFSNFTHEKLSDEEILDPDPNESESIEQKIIDLNKDNLIIEVDLVARTTDIVFDMNAIESYLKSNPIIEIFNGPANDKVQPFWEKWENSNNITATAEGFYYIVEFFIDPIVLRGRTNDYKAHCTIQSDVTTEVTEYGIVKPLVYRYDGSTTKKHSKGKVSLSNKSNYIKAPDINLTTNQIRNLTKANHDFTVTGKGRQRNNKNKYTTYGYWHKYSSYRKSGQAREKRCEVEGRRPVVVINAPVDVD